MDGLPHMVKTLVHCVFGAVERSLTDVHCIGEQVAALANALRVRAFLQFDALGFEEAFQIAEHFFFIDFFHKLVRT